VPIHGTMSNMDHLSASDRSGVAKRLRGALDPRRRLAERRIARENGSSFAFAARLFVAIALTFGLIGVVGYVLVDRNLEHRQIKDFADTQRADARGFEDVAARAATPADAIA
jgi:hypothetical protein